MILSDIVTFLGRFHPLVVHLPIGIFILAFFFDIISYHQKFAHCRQLVPLIVLIGFIFSILSVALGFMLSFSGDYDRNTLSSHKFAGILLTVLTGVFYLIHLPRFKKWISVPPVAHSVFMVMMIGFLIYTGHQGANLTHGSDYINLKVLNEQKRERPHNLNEVLLYEDVVQPILNKKCIQCHRTGKKKGRLSLETIADMKKGGKNGAGIVDGNAGESEIIQRVSLDPSHEDFMPADGKPPLTKTETDILKWWINKGMNTGEQRLTQVKSSGEISGAVSSFLEIGVDNTEGAFHDQHIDRDIPDTINMKAVENLRAVGLNVRVMFKRPVMLDVSLPSDSKDKLAKAATDLYAVAPNIVWLNLSDNKLTSDELKFLPSLKNLVKLRLEKNDISNNVCALLTPLTKLEAVNLNETAVSDECIESLRKMPVMKNVYSWRTSREK